MKVALGQINSTVGDLAGNVNRCLDVIQAAGRQAADLVVLPELAIPGYPPRDILYDASFVKAVGQANQDLARRASGGPPAVVGTLIQADRKPPDHPGLYNAAVLLNDGEVHMVAAKQLLPGYDVYFEPRWFVPGPCLPPIDVVGQRVGILVCEDLWDQAYDVHPPAALLAGGAKVLVSLNASPYRPAIATRRLQQARRPGCPIVYVNSVGANDELIFDGRSFVLDGYGNHLAQLSGFMEEVQVIDLEETRPMQAPPEEPQADLFQALVLGIRDFAAKNKLDRAFLGLSGGIDSSVAAVLAAEALGAERVTGVSIPSRYTDPRSTRCARQLAGALGMGFKIVELERLHTAAEVTLGELLSEGTGAENVQARLRAIVLMSYVNQFGGFLLNTSNKTELALGYATLYGDMAGALCPLADLTKLQVIELANWINATRNVIPEYTMERPPTAELRPGQVDPFDYSEIAPAMEDLVQANLSNFVLRRSEHKRRQMGIVLKVSEKAFGSGRMIPVTRR